MLATNRQFLYNVPFKYLMIFLTTIQCIRRSFDISQLTMFIAIIGCGLVAAITDITDPTIFWYVISFILYKYSLVPHHKALSIRFLRQITS